MYQTVLSVHNDVPFFNYVTEAVQQQSLDIELLTANDRLEALDLLDCNETIDWLAMSLAIPRISDGYLLLAKIANKQFPFPNEKIAVFVNECTDKVASSIEMHGVENIYAITELKNFFDTIGGSDSDEKEGGNNVKETESTASVDDVEKIQTALNQVMGPVGRFIFEKWCTSLEDLCQPAELVENIVKEIGNKEQIEQFYKALQG